MHIYFSEGFGFSFNGYPGKGLNIKLAFSRQINNFGWFWSGKWAHEPAQQGLAADVFHSRDLNLEVFEKRQRQMSIRIEKDIAFERLCFPIESLKGNKDAYLSQV